LTGSRHLLSSGNFWIEDVCGPPACRKRSLPAQHGASLFGVAQIEDAQGWDDDHIFHDLPDPTGKAPFHLDLADLIALATIRDMR
jgi:hypothetical protein